MNIGIISINMYTKGLNFACPLHTFAFQRFLTKNGIASKVIDYKPVILTSLTQSWSIAGRRKGPVTEKLPSWLKSETVIGLFDVNERYATISSNLSSTATTIRPNAATIPTCLR